MESKYSRLVMRSECCCSTAALRGHEFRAWSSPQVRTTTEIRCDKISFLHGQSTLGWSNTFVLLVLIRRRMHASSSGIHKSHERVIITLVPIGRLLNFSVRVLTPDHEDERSSYQDHIRHSVHSRALQLDKTLQDSTILAQVSC